MSKKNKNSIEQRTIDFIEKYLEIENILDASKPLPFKHSALKRTIKNRDDAVNEAKQLRQDWKLGNAPISNLLELIEENGIKIFEISLEEGVKFDGLSAVIAPSYVPVIALKKEKANRFKQLVLHAVSESYISLGKAASLLNISLYDFRRQVDLL